MKISVVVVLSLSFSILAYVEATCLPFGMESWVTYPGSKVCQSVEEDSTEAEQGTETALVAYEPDSMTWSWDWESFLYFKQQLLNSLGMGDSEEETIIKSCSYKKNVLSDDTKKWLGSDLYEILEANRKLTCELGNIHYLINKRYLRIQKMKERFEEKIAAANKKVKQLSEKIAGNSTEEGSSSLSMSPEAKILLKDYSARYRCGSDGSSGGFLCNNQLINSKIKVYLYVRTQEVIENRVIIGE